MKHKLKITILSILFGLLFGIPVYAAGNTYIIDQSDVLGEYISTLNEKAEISTANIKVKDIIFLVFIICVSSLLPIDILLIVFKARAKLPSL